MAFFMTSFFFLSSSNNWKEKSQIMMLVRIQRLLGERQNADSRLSNTEKQRNRIMLNIKYGEKVETSKGPELLKM